MPDSLLEKLATAIEYHVGKDTYISSTSADQLAQKVLGIVRDHVDRERESGPGELIAISERDLAICLNDDCPGFTGNPADGARELFRRLSRAVFAPETREDLTSRLTVAGQAADPEIDAIAAVRDALRPLPADAQMRIARYWLDRLQGGAIADDDDPF